MKRIAALILLVGVIFCLAQAANTGLSTAVTEADLNDIKGVVLSHTTTNKDWSNNIHTAYLVTSSLPKSDKLPKQEEITTLAKNTLKNNVPQSVESIYHAVGVVENLKIDANSITIDKSVVDTLRKVIEDGDSSLTDFFYAGNAVLSLRALKISKEISDDDLSSLVGKIVELADEDGVFRSSSTAKAGSLFNSGLALQLLARLVKDVKLTDDDTEHIDTALELVESILASGDDEEGVLEFSSDDSVNTLTTTSAVLVGLANFAAAVKKPLPQVTPAHISQIGQYLINQKHVGTLSDAYYLLSALRILQNNVISVPLVVAHERASLSATAKGTEGHLRVKVTDVFDKPVTNVKVLLIKAHPVGKDSHVLLSNQELALSDDKTAFVLNFLAAKPDQGFYALEYRVVPTESKYGTVDSAVRSVKIVGSISISDLEILVADSRDGLNKATEGSKFKAADQNHKIEESIHIDQTQFVSVKFRVRNAVGTNKPVLVQQAFVKFTHIKNGQEVIFVATPNENKLYSVLIDVGEVAKTEFKYLSGDYKLEIVAGDSFIQNPIHWIVSNSVKLAFKQSSSSSSSSSSSTTTPTSRLGPLPEIHHEFRKPESRPPRAVSNIFTLIVLSPLLFLLVGFIAVGANISQFPTGQDFIYAVGFLASLGAILALMGLYWVKLNLVQTLGYLAVLSIPTVFFGQKALSHIAKRKEKSE